MVAEPSVERDGRDSRGPDRYEQSITACAIVDDAVIAAAKLSHRYITDRHLPDKAIDLVDEAASRVRLRYGLRPPVRSARLRRS